jgi:hypothetical protein
MYRSPTPGSDTSDQRSHWVQMLLAHQGFLRTKEHVDGALQRRDVSFLRADGSVATAPGDCHAAVLTLRHTKTGVGEQAHHDARRRDALDVVQPLWELLRRKVETEPDAPLFTSGVHRVPVTRSLFLERVRAWISAAGLTGWFSGHSLRAGGATDAFDGRAPTMLYFHQGR